MTTDAEMKINYTAVLRDLERRLSGLDEQRSALEASIQSMRRLVVALEPDAVEVQGAASNGKAAPPAIPPGFFARKTPTEAYRELIRLWPGEYTPPQIADALLAGGMASKTRTELLQAIHSVLKRERAKERVEKETKDTEENPAFEILGRGRGR